MSRISQTFSKMLSTLNIFQITTTEVQDIDLSRFVPQEVDNTGITVASMDRFTSRNKTEPTEEDNGEKNWHSSKVISAQAPFKCWSHGSF